VGLVAEQRVMATLRRRSKNPWSEELTVDAGHHDEACAPGDPELSAASRQEIEQLFDRLRASLSPLGRDLFQRLILDEDPIAAVCAATGMSTAAVQAWSSRLKRLVQAVAAEMAAERSAPAQENRR
jgi:RNA polymerase sigma-70 factor (ECF subfamily)